MQIPMNVEAQNKKAKQPAIKKIIRIVKQEGWNYDDLRYVYKKIRYALDLKPGKKQRKLPRILSESDFNKFYRTIEQSEDLKAELLLKLLFYTGIRVLELVNIKVEDVDLNGDKIFIEQGKGSKDRYVLFDSKFKIALKTYMKSNPKNRYLFQSRHNDKYTSRRIQQIVKKYAEKAGVKATPHIFRHQFCTWLTRQGLSDAQIQLISGHASKKSLEVYQHLALSDVEEKYQEAMGKVRFS